MKRGFVELGLRVADRLAVAPAGRHGRGALRLEVSVIGPVGQTQAILPSLTATPTV